MIKSMTGYGSGKYENDGREYTIEIKTVNHRYSDVTIKMPRYLVFLEDKLRQYIIQSIPRGKTDVYISLVNMSDKGKSIKVDRQLAKKYIEEMKALVDEYNITDDITATSVMRMPDILSIENEADESLYWEELKKATDVAIDNIVEARKIEGERLKNDIEKRLIVIENNILFVEEKSSGLVEEYKKKLENRLKELEANNIIDESRLGAELVLYADKTSICEEITRLKSHIISFRQFLNNSDGPIGKKIDFLVQEMNREVNTIGSKANCIDITKYVVDTKNEIENIREQIQNIE
ncbi:MAG: YicC family protein [Clostridia bacterium]|nr:YicC family protein [Clostridia bacterium]